MGQIGNGPFRSSVHLVIVIWGVDVWWAWVAVCGIVRPLTGKLAVWQSGVVNALMDKYTRNRWT